MPGFPTAPAVQTITDKLATVAPELGNVAGYYVYLKDPIAGTIYESATPTDGAGNWSIAGVTMGLTYQYSYGKHPNTAYPFQGVYVASNPVTSVHHWGDGVYDVMSAANPAGAAVGAGISTLFGASITSGQPTLNVTDGFFTQAMVGWQARVPFANDANKNCLVATILSVQSTTQCTLSGNAGATVAGSEAFFWPASGVGADDAAAFAAAFAVMSVCTVLIPSLGAGKFFPVSTLPTLGTAQQLIGTNKRGCAIFHTGAGVLMTLSGNRHAIQRLTLFAGDGTTTVTKLLDASFGDYQDFEIDGSCAVNVTIGLWLTNAVIDSGGCYYNRFAQGNIHHNRRGVNFGDNSSGTSVVNENTFVQVAAQSNRDAGWGIFYAAGIIWLGCAAEQNGKVGSGPLSGTWGVGLKVSGGDGGYKWYGGWIEGNKNGTIRYDAVSAYPNSEWLPTALSQYAADGGGNGLLQVLPLGKNTVLNEFLATGTPLPAGHYYSSRRAVSSLSGTPVATNLGANVTSVTPLGNDIRGRLTIVMAGALAANTRIATITFNATYGTAALGEVLLINQTSGAGLAVVNFYQTPNTGVGFDLFCDQALAAGTYIIVYKVEA